MFEKIARGEKRALLALATGSGKTFIAVNLLRRIADAGQLRKALFICDRDELRNQGLAAFQNAFGADAADVSGRNPQKNARVLIATYQTLDIDREDSDANFLTANYPENYFSHIVIDECHRSAWGKWSLVLKRNPNAIQVGLTATPLPFGRAHYDSLQIQMSKRMSSGLSLGASYTVSKFLESTSYLNNNDPKPEKVISNSDRPQRLVLYGIYELPFGQGKPLANSSHPLIERLVGGWQFNWVITYQSMGPLGFGGAERIRRSDSNPRTVDQWFDVSQFVPQEPFTLLEHLAEIFRLPLNRVRVIVPVNGRPTRVELAYAEVRPL